ncbi:MAG: STM3941 family protein [Bacteroidia bacterium]
MKALKEEKTIEIKRKKGKTIILSIASIVFCFFSVLLWINFFNQKSYPSNTLEFVLFIGLPFFLIGGLFSAKKIFDQRPAFVISPEGISNYSNFVTSDLILWSDINRFEVHKVKGVTLIIICVENPEQVFQLSSGIKKIFIKIGNWSYGTPFSITVNVLDCNLNDLLEILNYKLAKYNKQK